VHASLTRWFGTWRFPAACLAALLASETLLVAMALWPAGETGLAAFAADFRRWCFGQEAGAMEGAQLAVFLVEPPALALLVAAIWWSPLREATARQLAPWAAGGVAAVMASAAAMAATAPAAPEGELPFPAEALRTELPFPALGLVDQDGAPFDGFPGKVTLVTAVYARCGATCPMVLAQTRGAIEAVPVERRDDLRVVAITLDPTKDTPETLRDWATGQGVSAPLWHLASGPPAHVEATLDRLGFARSRDPVSGVIDHANLFLLVDREGRLAYRFSLGARQAEWLGLALNLLLAE
jgi:protein SCO1/2